MSAIGKPRLSEHDRRLEAGELERERRVLEKTWASPRGFIGWLSEVGGAVMCILRFNRLDSPRASS